VPNATLLFFMHIFRDLTASWTNSYIITIYAPQMENFLLPFSAKAKHGNSEGSNTKKLG